MLAAEEADLRAEEAALEAERLAEEAKALGSAFARSSSARTHLHHAQVPTARAGQSHPHIHPHMPQLVQPTLLRTSPLARSSRPPAPQRSPWTADAAAAAASWAFGQRQNVPTIHRSVHRQNSF